jgi:hypothetical protein
MELRQHYAPVRGFAPLVAPPSFGFAHRLAPSDEPAQAWIAAGGPRGRAA